jgi:hypothetical protein
MVRDVTGSGRAGVLTVQGLAGGHFFMAGADFRKFYTHEFIVFFVGTLALRLILKWRRNKQCVLAIDSLFLKYASTANA